MIQSAWQVQVIYTELSFHPSVFSMKLGRAKVIFFHECPLVGLGSEPV